MLPAFIVLAVSMPAGFAIANAVRSGEAEQPSVSRMDPDPSTDAIELREALRDAEQSGDREAIATATDAVTEEMRTRMSVDEREATDSAPPQPAVPPGTLAYINPALTDIQVKQCKTRLGEAPRDRLCELILLYDEGKARGGAYTREQVDNLLGEGQEEGQ